MSDLLVPDFQVLGPERDAAMERFNDQMAAWGLVMPDMDPLVVQFGLNDFYKVGLIEYWIANNEDTGYCGKFLFVFDGQMCPYHHHDLKDEVFFILKGRVRLVIDEVEKEMNQGDTLRVTPGVKHSFTGIGNALVLEVSTPSVVKDNLFADKRIGRDGVI